MQTVNAVPADGVEANPEALRAIIKASESYSIIASQDIVDVRGLKLWAQGQPVSASLQQRLLERKLQHPLESCLMAENGVTLFSLHDDLHNFLSGDTPLAVALRPWASTLMVQIKNLPLHSVAQLLLTAAMATRPNTLPHAVQAMALAGAMACREGAEVDVRLAMLGGLLHDIGEVYIQPRYLVDDAELDILGHKHMVVHPRVAQQILSSTTDYPEALCRAIGEHHERLDGSGYPARLAEKALSPLGSLLAVMEVTLGILRTEVAPLTRASFALRVVPGEFDLPWTGLVCEAARLAQEVPGPTPSGKSAGKSSPRNGPLDEISRHMKRALELNDILKEQSRSGPVLDIVALAIRRLERLHTAWNALGIWGLDNEPLSAQVQFETEMAAIELRQHLHELQRECLLLAERLIVAEKVLLDPLWLGLFKLEPVRGIRH
jgi:putative nucleotidyltransferase with HDIG domain